MNQSEPIELIKNYITSKFPLISGDEVENFLDEHSHFSEGTLKIKSDHYDRSQNNFLGVRSLFVALVVSIIISLALSAINLDATSIERIIIVEIALTGIVLIGVIYFSLNVQRDSYRKKSLDYYIPLKHGNNDTRAQITVDLKSEIEKFRENSPGSVEKAFLKVLGFIRMNLAMSFLIWIVFLFIIYAIIIVIVSFSLIIFEFASNSLNNLLNVF